MASGNPLPNLDIQGRNSLSDFDAADVGSACWDYINAPGDISRCCSQGYTILVKLRQRLTALSLPIDVVAEGVGYATVQSMEARATALGVSAASPVRAALNRAVTALQPDVTSDQQAAFTDQDRRTVTLWAVFLAFYDSSNVSVSDVLPRLSMDGDAIPMAIGYGMPPPSVAADAPSTPVCARFQDAGNAGVAGGQATGATGNSAAGNGVQIRRAENEDRWLWYGLGVAMASAAHPVVKFVSRAMARRR